MSVYAVLIELGEDHEQYELAQTGSDLSMLLEYAKKVVYEDHAEVMVVELLFTTETKMALSPISEKSIPPS